MSISSHFFLLILLPIIVFVYYILFKQTRQKMYFLLILSYGFYALADLKFLPLLLLLSWFTFWAAKRGWTLTAVIVNLLALCLFKYWNFGIEGFNLLIKTMGISKIENLLQWGLPLGISFFTFKHIGYLLDVRQNRYQATNDFWTFATFSAYFPQISAGPISNFIDTANQLGQLPARLGNKELYASLLFLSRGISKKIIIADTLGVFLATDTFDKDGFNGILLAWVVVLAFGMQLYFDFSGYTDMVLGISMLFGIVLPVNFNNPYLSNNIREFWERWHMSLSGWFRTYVFLPLSRYLLRRWGSESRSWAQYTANLITMTLIGLWHGPSWSFLLWGIYNGLMLNLNVWWMGRNKKSPAWISRPLLVLCVLIGWALFMSPDKLFLKHLILHLCGFGGVGPINQIFKFVKDILPTLFVAVILAFSGYSDISFSTNDIQLHGGVFWQAGLWGLLAALSLFLLAGQVQFLYIQF